MGSRIEKFILVFLQHAAQARPLLAIPWTRIWGLLRVAINVRAVISQAQKVPVPSGKNSNRGEGQREETLAGGGQLD